MKRSEGERLRPRFASGSGDANDKAFDKTAAIYKLAGAEGKFERK